MQHSGGSPSGSDCTGTCTYDMNARTQSGLDPNLAAGATRFAQCGSRDPADPFTTRLSNAVEFDIDTWTSSHGRRVACGARSPEKGAGSVTHSARRGYAGRRDATRPTAQ